MAFFLDIHAAPEAAGQNHQVRKGVPPSMSKNLIIAEKGTVAAKIAMALGGFRKVDGWLESDTTIIAPAAGHLVEIYSEEMAKAGRDIAVLPIIPDAFSLKLIDSPNKQRAYYVLEKLMRRSDVASVTNACDAGREGELIFRLIYKHAQCTKPMLRLWMNSTTDEAIRDAHANLRPGSDYDYLADAAEIRGEGDFIVGINSSRAMTRLYERQKAVSEIWALGRVQTPTLTLPYMREMEILTFKPASYWELHGTFALAAGTYVGKWLKPKVSVDKDGAVPTDDFQHRLISRAMVDALFEKCNGVTPSSVTEETTPSKKGPGTLFDSTGLQREANRKLGFSAAYTLEIAQHLYLNLDLITYPRTDSSYLPEDFIPETKRTISALIGTPYESHAKRILDSGWVKPNKRVFDSSKVSDHYAIVPTGSSPKNLEPDQALIYDLIVKKYLSVFHPSAEYAVTTRITVVEAESFKTTGRVLVSPGWMAVYGSSETADQDDAGAGAEDAKSLVKYVPGEIVRNDSLVIKALKTKPPLRYTEDTLLGAMETAGQFVEDEIEREALKERGLGTPVTRSAMIETLLSTVDGKGRKKEAYLRREKKFVAPTAKGMEAVRFLIESGINQLTSPTMTGDWEYKLRLMEKGQYSRGVFKRELSEMTVGICEIMKQKYAGVDVKTLKAACPKCGAGIEVAARTFACEKACGFTIWREIAGRTLKVSEAETLISNGAVHALKGFTNAQKKKFEAGLKLLADGKLEFNTDHNSNTKDSKGNAVQCPKCAKQMKRWKGKTYHFWACSDRESCKHTMNDHDGDPVERPAPRPCPKCEQPMYLRNADKSPFWGCTNRESCNHTMNDKDGEPVEKPDPHPCPECGKPMYLKNPGSTPFWGCSGFVKGGGGCNNTLKDKDGVPVPKPLKTAVSTTQPAEDVFL
ncbi:DNA topoisomerase [Pseudomonas lactis]|uniref:DNA topoisomerase n=1 Tax=Pseudomonas lactis TaxID=1615674 RepID=UPI003F7DDF49